MYNATEFAHVRFEHGEVFSIVSPCALRFTCARTRIVIIVATCNPEMFVVSYSHERAGNEPRVDEIRWRAAKNETRSEIQYYTGAETVKTR
jgi:hypothetical protein